MPTDQRTARRVGDRPERANLGHRPSLAAAGHERRRSIGDRTESLGNARPAREREADLGAATGLAVRPGSDLATVCMHDGPRDVEAQAQAAEPAPSGLHDEIQSLQEKLDAANKWRRRVFEVASQTCGMFDELGQALKEIDFTLPRRAVSSQW